MSLTTSTTSPPLAPQRADAPHQAVYADVMDQISHTVQQLVLAAIARAREKAGLPFPSAAQAQVALSLREYEVLQRIVAGDSNKMIARALDLSPHTVKRHVANILEKLDLRSRGQAAAWWLSQHERHPQQ
jgi:LuxR family maltose regulon positive regulatory protein